MAHVRKVAMSSSCAFRIPVDSTSVMATMPIFLMIFIKMCVIN